MKEILGIIMLSAAGMLVGKEIQGLNQKRLRVIHDIITLLSIIKSQIYQFNKSLIDVLKVCIKYGLFKEELSYCKARITAGDDTYLTWCKAFHDIKLDEKNLRRFMDIGRYLGKYDLNLQVSNLEEDVKYFLQEEKKMSDNISKNNGLYTGMGIIIGGAIGILLL